MNNTARKTTIKKTVFTSVTSLVAACVLYTMTLPLHANEPHRITHEDLIITTPFVFVTPPAALTAGGYLHIENTGDKDDILIGGTAAFAGKTEIHEMKMIDSVMKMKHLAQGLVIPAGESIELKPGGLHVMFMGLKEDLVEGKAVAGTLEFRKAGTVQIEYQVLDRKKHMSGKKHKHDSH